ncbi:MAG: hypothetical protein HYZ90_01665, partial [Candidatus Omnitrophica bacterium]|nr:hypothetical protein [Candidatus Omnitrophota bacterium]
MRVRNGGLEEQTPATQAIGQALQPESTQPVRAGLEEERIPAGDHDPREYDADQDLLLGLSRLSQVFVQSLGDERIEVLPFGATPVLPDHAEGVEVGLNQVIHIGRSNPRPGQIWLSVQGVDPKVSRLHATVELVLRDGEEKIAVINQSNTNALRVKTVLNPEPRPVSRKAPPAVAAAGKIANGEMLGQLEENELKGWIRKLKGLQQDDPPPEPQIENEIGSLIRVFELQVKRIQLLSLSEGRRRVLAAVAELASGGEQKTALSYLLSKRPYRVTPAMARAYLSRGQDFGVSAPWMDLLRAFRQQSRGEDPERLYDDLSGSASAQVQIRWLSRRIQPENRLRVRGEEGGSREVWVTKIQEGKIHYIVKGSRQEETVARSEWERADSKIEWLAGGRQLPAGLEERQPAAGAENPYLPTVLKDKVLFVMRPRHTFWLRKDPRARVVLNDTGLELYLGDLSGGIHLRVTETFDGKHRLLEIARRVRNVHSSVDRVRGTTLVSMGWRADTLFKNGSSPFRVGDFHGFSRIWDERGEHFELQVLGVSDPIGPALNYPDLVV